VVNTFTAGDGGGGEDWEGGRGGGREQKLLVDFLLVFKELGGE
jgi:hypothetical protein